MSGRPLPGPIAERLAESVASRETAERESVIALIRAIGRSAVNAAAAGMTVEEHAEHPAILAVVLDYLRGRDTDLETIRAAERAVAAAAVALGELGEAPRPPSLH